MSPSDAPDQRTSSLSIKQCCGGGGTSHQPSAPQRLRGRPRAPWGPVESVVTPPHTMRAAWGGGLRRGGQLPVMPNNFLLWPVGAGYRGRMPVEVDLLAGLPLRDAARPCVQKVVKNLAGTSAYRLAATVGRWAAYLNVFLTAVRSPLGQLRDVLYFSRQINRDHPQGGTGYKF